MASIWVCIKKDFEQWYTLMSEFLHLKAINCKKSEIKSLYSVVDPYFRIQGDFVSGSLRIRIRIRRMVKSFTQLSVKREKIQYKHFDGIALKIFWQYIWELGKSKAKEEKIFI